MPWPQIAIEASSSFEECLQKVVSKSDIHSITNSFMSFMSKFAATWHGLLWRDLAAVEDVACVNAVVVTLKRLIGILDGNGVSENKNINNDRSLPVCTDFLASASLETPVPANEVDGLLACASPLERTSRSIEEDLLFWDDNLVELLDTLDEGSSSTFYPVGNIFQSKLGLLSTVQNSKDKMSFSLITECVPKILLCRPSR